MVKLDDLVDKLQRRLPDAPRNGRTLDLLEDLLADAHAFILTYTNRNELPEQLTGACVKLAAIEYNRLGMEGESAHSEGSVSRSVEALPADIKAELTPWVLARTVV